MASTDTVVRKRLIRKLIIDLSIMSVIGVGLALIGPFGSFQEPLAFRLVSWLSFAYIGYFIYRPMGYVVTRLGAMFDLPPVGLWVAAVLIGTVPMSVAVWSIAYFPGPIAVPSVERALIYYTYVLIVGGGVTALFYALEWRSGPVNGPAAGDQAAMLQPPIQLPALVPTEQPEIRFLGRLPPALGTDLIALEMEDHYVRAHTAAGSDLILLRMRDAVAELEGLAGAQVHRSWWVARDAVEGTRKQGRNVRLRLRGGLEAPVSRSAAFILKKQGWY